MLHYALDLTKGLGSQIWSVASVAYALILVNWNTVLLCFLFLLVLFVSAVFLTILSLSRKLFTEVLAITDHEGDSWFRRKMRSARQLIATAKTVLDTVFALICAFLLMFIVLYPVVLLQIDPRPVLRVLLWSTTQAWFTPLAILWAWLLYQLRLRARCTYGIIETVVGMAGLFVWTPLKASSQDVATELVHILTVLSGIYIIIRGLDNIETGLRSLRERPLGVIKLRTIAIWDRVIALKRTSLVSRK